jgi:hypothetical protein
VLVPLQAHSHAGTPACQPTAWEGWGSGGGGGTGAVKCKELKLLRSRCSICALHANPFTGSLHKDAKIPLIKARTSEDSRVASIVNSLSLCAAVLHMPRVPWTQLWDLTAGKSVLSVDAHRAAVTSVAFHPVEWLLASTSVDRSAKVPLMGWSGWVLGGGVCVALPLPPSRPTLTLSIAYRHWWGDVQAARPHFVTRPDPAYPPRASSSFTHAATTRLHPTPPPPPSYPSPFAMSSGFLTPPPPLFCLFFRRCGTCPPLAWWAVSLTKSGPSEPASLRPRVCVCCTLSCVLRK